MSSDNSSMRRKISNDNSSMRGRKPKLTVVEQIEHLKSKGVTFDLCSEEDARETLSDKTYYFKLAAYRVLFEKRIGGAHDGEYVGLDFGHLRDLAAIDHMLRYTLLPMTLDIEHFAKVKLMRNLTERPDEDGYSIVGEYLGSLSKKSLDIRNGEIRRLENDRYSGDLVRRYDGAYPAWVFIELISFGGFIDFYRFCSLRWDDREMRKEHYLLKQVKAIRNACAHSTAIVNGFAPGTPSNVRTPNEVAEALARIGLNKRARHSKMSNARVQQIAMTAFAYRKLVKGTHSREMCRTLVDSLIRRSEEHSDWYARSDYFRSALAFLNRVFDRWI